MIKYGISYYTTGPNGREPLTGLQVRLLRPGQAWAEGIPLYEKETTGFYEGTIEDEVDQGFYEIHDNRENPAGSFSGRTVTVGKLDARGIQSRSIYTNHIEDGAILSTKIANGAIANNHLEDNSISLQKLRYTIENQSKGVGNSTGQTPAVPGSDKYASHAIDGSYSSIPIVLIAPKCDAPLWLESVTLSGDQLTVVVGFGSLDISAALRYDLVIFG